jgi:hypothetical protein
MSKKTKRLYGRMQHSIAKKQDGIDVLETKRKASEQEASGVVVAAKKGKGKK